MKNARTPLLRSLRKAILISDQSVQTGIPADELEELQTIKTFSRRDFISTSLKAGALLGIASSFPVLTSHAASYRSSKYSIAIIGGGIAGLHAAWTLQKNGISSTIYEGSSRTGGRMLSAHNIMGNNLTTELGGEYIDSDHENIFALAKEFQLEILDTQPSLAGLKTDDFFIGGQHYSLQQAIIEFNLIKDKIQHDAASIGENFQPGGLADLLDKKSIDEYLDSIGSSGWFRKFLQVAYESEYGSSTAEQSSLNLISLIDTNTGNGEFKYFGASDERYKIKGGNQQIVDKLAYQLKDNIRKEHVLARVKNKGNGYQLSFTNGKEVTADFVILAIPYSLLREVKMDVEMSAEKKYAIRNLKYGTNAKMLFGFDKRVWRDKGYGGYIFNDVVQNGWDNSLGQNDNSGYGGFTVFLGGDAGKNLNAAQYDLYLNGIDTAFPGAKGVNNTKRAIMHWPTQPFTKGSYACLTTGSWINIAPYVAAPIGNIYFAGEHCSDAFQGFMEGGAETGKLAAEAILKKVKV